MNSHQVGVYIGRFQPLHIGHQHVIEEALKQVDHLVLLIGSANVARSPLNPFTLDERRAMIEAVYPEEVKSKRLVLLSINDYPYDDEQWISVVEDTVAGAVADLGCETVALAGYGKDSTSFYLKMFPEWGSIQIDTQHGTISASDIRYDYLRALPRWPERAVHPRVMQFLQEFSFTETFRELSNEAFYYRNYKNQWGKGPFLTADALVLWRGKVLLVTRGKTPGRGLFAMPGGFLEDNETLHQAAMRELKEETGLELEDALYTDTFTADFPARSLRGRVVSFVQFIGARSADDLSGVKGADDAEHAAWYDFSSLKPEQFFEDHYHIISHILGVNELA